jgi:5'/3'-nucleotidase SurE
VRPLVDELHAAGHQVSVAIPAASRSWIGKAHIIEASLTASFVHPDSFYDDGTWDSDYTPAPDSASAQLADWVVIQNGTPASCAQLGLYSLFADRPPIDLVISGPNHGRNASTIYNLSSGTVGGALEAVFCGQRGIAISFGSKDPQAGDVIAAAARHAVRIVDHLLGHWDERVELYNINVPMRVDVETQPVLYTRTLPYYWSRGCLYAEVEPKTKSKMANGALTNGVHKEQRDEVAVNGSNGVNGVNGVNGANGVNGHVEEPSRKQRHFKWSADLSDMKKRLQQSEEGTDAHTVLNGSTRYVLQVYSQSISYILCDHMLIHYMFCSVTALRANFWHVPGLDGPLHFDQ